jgi:hypothetical protein
MVPFIPLLAIGLIVLFQRWLRRRTEWATIEHPDGLFSFRYPGSWSGVIRPDRISLGEPDDSARVFALAFLADGGSLSEFAATRFAAATHAALGEPREFNGEGWRGLFQESEGPLSADDSQPVRQAILCASAGDLFVTLTLMAYREIYVQNQARYQAIFESLRLKPGATAEHST